MSTIKKATTHPEPADLLQYLPLYNVVICSTCKYAIQPQAIARHLKEIHHIHRSHRRPYMQHVSKLSLNDAGTVIEAKIHEFPVPLLPVQDGLVCESEGCEHLCVSTKRMRTHWLDQHGRSGQAFLDWQPVKLQTFFRGNLLRYFTDPQASFVKGEKVPHCDLKSNPDGKIKDRAKGHHIPLSSIIKPSSYSWLNDSDAQLVNHYITSTSLSISTSITKQFWKIHAPYLAIQHPFLLHGFLALSALHLAHISQSNQPSFLISANTHQSLAMPLFRTAIANVTIANSEAILVFSHLLVLYSFASESQDERLFLTSSSISSFNIPVDKEDGSDILPPWLYFLRSGCSLLCPVWGYLESSSVAPLAEMWDIPLLVPSSPTPLLMHLLSIPPPPTSPTAWTRREIELYTKAAHDLASAFASTQVAGDEFTTWDALRVWPMQLSIPFLNLVKESHPTALILLAHYCILLKKVEGHWYFKGRATRLLRSILKHLGREWWEFIRWPLEEIGVQVDREGEDKEME